MDLFMKLVNVSNVNLLPSNKQTGISPPTTLLFFSSQTSFLTSYKNCVKRETANAATFSFAVFSVRMIFISFDDIDNHIKIFR